MSASTTIRRVSYSEILGAPNASELIEEYAAECSIAQIGKINEQPEMYAMLEESGRMRFFGVFAGSELVGFASLLMSILPHYGRKVAMVESIFIAHGHRANGTGLCLMGAIERHANDEGCGSILYSAPAGSRFDKLLELTHVYARTNHVYCRSFA